MTEFNASQGTGRTSLLGAPRPFVSILRPAPLMIAGGVFSLAIGLAAYLGLKAPAAPARDADIARKQPSADHPAALDALPRTYSEAFRGALSTAPTSMPKTPPDAVAEDSSSADPRPPRPVSAAPPTDIAEARLFFADANSTPARAQTSGAPPPLVVVTGSAELTNLARAPESLVERSARSDTAGPASHGASKDTYALKAGDFINAALLTAIDSDIPGTVVAQVTRNVFDHASGRMLLIPQGARLVGRYDGKPIFGQRRAVIVWREIVLPDGRSISLDNLSGTDAAGASGVEDRVDTHISPIMRAIALSTALTVAGAAAQSADTRSNGGAILNDTASGVSTRASEVGQRFVDRDLTQAPTLHVRQGWPVAVIVDRDLALPPYYPAAAAPSKGPKPPFETRENILGWGRRACEVVFHKVRKTLGTAE